jgi:hypothetical protein
MMSFGEFAAMMERNSTTVVERLEGGLLVVSGAVAAEAKRLIGHENAGWPALAESTVEEKDRLGYTGRISATDPLYRTGELRESIEATVHGLEAAVWSHDKVAVWQEIGTSRIPPRPFLSSAMRQARPLAEREFGLIAANLTSPTRIRPPP